MPIIGLNDLAKSGDARTLTNRNLYRIAGSSATYIAQSGDVVDFGAAYIDSGGGSSARLGIARVSDGVVLHSIVITPSSSGIQWWQTATSYDLGAIAGTEVQLFQTYFATADELSDPFMGYTKLIPDAEHKGQVSNPAVLGMQDYNGSWTDDGFVPLAYFNVTSSGPTITDIDGDESVYPGQSYIIQATDDIAATAGTVFWEELDGSNPVQHTVTNWDDATDQITVTAVQGNHKYGSGLYRVRVVLADTSEILFDNAGTGLSLEANTATGYGFVDVVDPANDEPNAASYQSSTVVATGDQLRWRDIGNANAVAFNADTTVANTNAPADIEGSFWDATDSTWGAWETISLTDPNALTKVFKKLRKALRKTMKTSMRKSL